MIIRKQNFKTDAEEVSMMLSFGQPDIKKSMQQFYSFMAEHCGHTFAVSTPITEGDLLHFFEHNTFSFLVPKYRELLAIWAFKMALRHRFILSSQDDDNPNRVYFLSQRLRARVGRPQIVDDEE